MGVGGFHGASKGSLHLVDAYETLVNDSGACFAVVWLNQALFCPHSQQILIVQDLLGHKRYIVLLSYSLGSNAL
jgi:hypothetical protein